MKAFAITLMDSPARRVNADYVCRDLAKWGFAPEIFPALDFTDRRFSHARAKEGAGMTAGEIATSYSHCQVHQKIVQLDEPCLIVEDDAYFPRPVAPDWATGIAHVLTCGAFDSSMPEAPKVEFTGEKTLFGQLTKGMPWGTQCYFVTPQGAKAMIEGASPISYPIDVLLHRLSIAGRIQGCVARDCHVGQNPLISSHVWK